MLINYFIRDQLPIYGIVTFHTASILRVSKGAGVVVSNKNSIFQILKEMLMNCLIYDQLLIYGTNKGTFHSFAHSFVFDPVYWLSNIEVIIVSNNHI